MTRSSEFTVYPAIDVLGGKCVRLFQGDYAQSTVYHDDPVAMAKTFVAQGARWVHVVDLDGAKQGQPVHMRTIERIRRETGVCVQYGGGIRTLEHAAMMLDVGVDRIILGTAAVTDPQMIGTLVAAHGPERIAIGIDARDGFVATEGWLSTSHWRSEALAAHLCSFGITQFIFTDIARDGALQGPNIVALRSFLQGHTGRVIASGGVSTLADIRALQACQEEGCVGVIVGRALYTGQISFKDVGSIAEDVGT